MLIGGLELLFLLLLGEIPAVGALYSGLGLEIFAGIPFFTGFTLKTTLLLCHVGIGCAAIGFLLTAKITERSLIHIYIEPMGVMYIHVKPEDCHEIL